MAVMRQGRLASVVCLVLPPSGKGGQPRDVVNVWLDGVVVAAPSHTVFPYHPGHAWVRVAAGLMAACVTAQPVEHQPAVAPETVNSQTLLYEQHQTLRFPATVGTTVAPHLVAVLDVTRRAFVDARVRGYHLMRHVMDSLLAQYEGNIPEEVGTHLWLLVRRSFAFVNPGANGPRTELPGAVAPAWDIATRRLLTAYPRSAWRAPLQPIHRALHSAANHYFTTTLPNAAGDHLRSLLLSYLSTSFPVAKERLESMLDARVVEDQRLASLVVLV